MRTLKNYSKGILSTLIIFFITNSSFAGITSTNQSGNLPNTTVFYILIALAILLLLGIFFLSNSVRELMKSDFYKQKVYEDEKKKRNSTPTTVAVLILLLGLPMIGSSLSVSAASSPELASDIPLTWVWMMVIINLILLGVAFYIRNLFYQILRSVKPKKISAKKGAEQVSETSKISKLLTDAVPIEREDEIKMDHEYDGIYELDNNLPPWWVWSFYVCIAFSFVYMINYHVLETGDLQEAEYNKALEEGEKEVAEYLKTQKLNVDESSVVMLTESSDLEKGKTIFGKKCTACHGKEGEGVIGPNLTDKFWIHGGSISDVFKIIKYGAPSKGMQAWEEELNPIEIQQISSYIKSIQGTAEGKGKEPQGDEYKE